MTSATTEPPRPRAPQAGAVRTALARASGVLVLGLLAWRAPAGLARFAGELVGTPLAERRRALASPLEERLRAERGAEADLWLSLRPHVPERGELFVSYREDARGRELYRGLQRLRALLCPVSLRGMPYDPRARSAEPRSAEPRSARAESLVLELDSGRPPESFGACEELARGPGYRLLRVLAEPPR